MGKAPVPCLLLLVGTRPAAPFGRHVPRSADGLGLPSMGLMSLKKKVSQSLPRLQPKLEHMGAYIYSAFGFIF